MTNLFVAARSSKMHESWKPTAIKTATKSCTKSATRNALARIVSELDTHLHTSEIRARDSHQTAIKLLRRTTGLNRSSLSAKSVAVWWLFCPG
jgi:hypothetical protein